MNVVFFLSLYGVLLKGIVLSVNLEVLITNFYCAELLSAIAAIQKFEHVKRDIFFFEHTSPVHLTRFPTIERLLKKLNFFV